MSKTHRITALLAAALCLALTAGSPAFALGTSAGTSITNTASVTYEDAATNSYSGTSNTVSTTVNQVAAVDIDPDRSGNTSPSTTIYYLHTVTNNGNGDDTLNVTTAGTLAGWTVGLFFEDGSGTCDAGDSTALSDSATDADATPDVGQLGENATIDICVAVTVPAGTPGGTVDNTTVTVTSSFDTNVSDAVTDTTTVDGPGLSVTKSVDLANADPGDTLTYTIVVTNGGNADALNIVLRDAIPANTTYVANSITQDGNPRGDGTGDGDNADYNVTNPGEVTVNIGTLAASASTTIVFQVTVD